MRGLDFRFNVGNQKIGAPFHGLKAFFTTPQLALLDKARPTQTSCFVSEVLCERQTQSRLQQVACCASVQAHAANIQDGASGARAEPWSA